MRAMIVGPAERRPAPATGARDAAHVRVYGTDATLAVTDLAEPAFDPKSSRHAQYVKLRVLTFALNYRDRAWIAERARQQDAADASRAIGSEFCGIILAVGAEVRDLQPGERVIADMSWPVSGVPGVLPGVPTNCASQEIQVLHRSKLIRVPDDMDDATAAAFALCGQTGLALARHAQVRDGDAALVTAGTSNTSLMVIQVLAARGVRVHALTRRPDAAPLLVELGCEQVFPADEFADGNSALHREIRQLGGYRAIVDPFSDVYVEPSMAALGFFGRYVTCGVIDQDTDEPPRVSLSRILNLMIVKNLTVRGNCLGLASDLQDALALWSEGRLRPIVAAVHDTVAGFCADAFAPTRIGKVIFRYRAEARETDGGSDVAAVV